MNLSIAVQHHPARRGRLHRIGLAPGYDVVFDPDPHGHPSPWRTYRRALESTPADASHRLVIQDDAVVCHDFERLAVEAIAERPVDVVSFYCGMMPYENSIAVERAALHGERWAVLGVNSWVPVVALSWPVGLLSSVLELTPPGDDPVHWSDDANIGGWFREMRIAPPVCRVPTLVDHPNVSGSLIGGKAAPYRRGVCLTDSLR